VVVEKTAPHWTTGGPGYRVVFESFPTNDGGGGSGEETAPTALSMSAAPARSSSSCSRGASEVYYIFNAVDCRNIS